MTYKLDPVVEKIGSPIILRFDDPSLPERCFSNGKDLAEAGFAKRLLITEIVAEKDSVIVKVVENEEGIPSDPVHGINQDTESFF